MLRIALLVCVLPCLIVSAAVGATIGEAKALPIGSTTIVSGSVTLLGPTECYLEATNNSCGVWVIGDTQGLQINDIATASGTSDVVGGECVIRDATLLKSQDTHIVTPFAMRNRWIGGGPCGLQQAAQDFENSWKAASGANNTGIIIKTWGTVTAVCYSPITNAHWFQIDDGSGVTCDYGDSGVIVYSDADISEGDFVTVTGVSSVEVALNDATKLVRVIRPRSSDDVSCVTKASTDSICPFSDEFDSSTLDSRWGIVGKASYISLTSNPGWLALSIDPLYGYGYKSLSLVQTAVGDWDMEMKFRPQFSAPTGTSYSLSVVLTPSALISTHSPTLYLATAQSIEHTPETASFTLAGQAAGTLYNGTYWLRVRMRRPMVYVSASSDGFVHSPGEQYGDCTFEYSAATSYDYISFQTGSQSRDVSYTVLIDYIRFTRVDQ